MRFSTASELFPLMTEAEFEELKADMCRHGQREPIVLDREGRILDGRNRYRACKALAVEPKCVTVDTTDPVAYVVSENLHRRHLNESQRAMVAARVAKLGRGERKSNTANAVSQADASGRLKVSVDSIQRARQVLDHGTPELVQGVEQGHVPVSAAASLVETPPEYQRAVVARVASGEARTVTEAKRQVRKETLPETTPLIEGRYRVIYADCPWKYNSDGLDDYGAAERHYPTMSTDELSRLPIGDLATDDAVLFLWATSPLLPDALAVMTAWGFTYKSSFVWDKVKHNFGHYNSVRHEFLLVGTRGSCKPDAARLFDSVVCIERAGHSAKPEEFRTIIETLYTWGPRVELFARSEHPGWAAWGNEL